MFFLLNLGTAARFTSILHLNFALLAEATTDPLWLADQLFSEGILSYQIKVDLETNMSSYDKTSKLWTAVMTAVKHQRNSTQTLLTVCHVMKQRLEQTRLADRMISQLGVQSENKDHESHFIECRVALFYCSPEQLILLSVHYIYN